MKIISIVGARPQFIKAAMVSREIANQPGIEEIIVHTGQHFDDNMSEVFFMAMKIRHPHYNLGVNSLSHGAMTGQMLEKIEKVLMDEKPDFVLVYGDTNSTLAGALAAVKLHIPVGHVEAGLRSFNRRMPEEINRVVADHVSDLLFAPTGTAVNNLKREGISEKKIFRSGDVMYDAALFYGAICERESDILAKLSITPKNYALVTWHRAENTDDSERLKALFDGLKNAAEQIPVVLPLHPRTKLALEREGIANDVGKEMKIIDPVGYLDMIKLEKHARIIATDSGGVQKEAYFFKVPCVTLRTETEWVELVEMGWNQLVDPSSSEKISSAILNAKAPDKKNGENIYGDGHASQKIVKELLKL